MCLYLTAMNQTAHENQRPFFVIDDNASQFQREVIEDLRCRIYAEPLLFDAALKIRQLCAEDRGSEAIAVSQSFLQEKTVQSHDLTDARELIARISHTQADAVYQLDPSSEKSLKESPDFRLLLSDSRLAKEIRRERIRNARLAHFVLRVIQTEDKPNTQQQTG